MGLMRVVIAGGSGQVGTMLARAYHTRGDDITVLSRHPESQEWRTALWSGASLGDWANALEGCDVVINLAGRSVNCRYTPKHRREIMESRTASTKVIGEAIAGCAQPPKVWLQAATATIYAHRYDAPNDELAGVIGGEEPNAPDTWKFSIDVAKAWEQTCTSAITPHTRKVLLRSAMVMSPDRGGIFDTLLTLVRRGLGGNAGDGRQYVSWIHETDFVAAIDWLIAHAQLDGAVNIASPNPLTYAEFMRVLREAAHVPVGLPSPAWLLEIGAIFLKTETELVLKSRRVIPTRLLESGFRFTYPQWGSAAVDLVQHAS